MNYVDYCELFYASHYLPIAYYDESGLVSAAGYLGKEDPYPFVHAKLAAQGSPGIYVSSDTGYYGRVRTEDGYFIIGPAYGIAVSDDIIRAFMNKNAIPSDQENEVSQFLRGLPLYTYNHFLNLLQYLHFTFNGEVPPVRETLLLDDKHYEQEIGQKHAELVYQDRDNGQVHGTYSFEQRMLELIRQGSVSELENYLLTAARVRPLREGNLADNPLRQAKNVFIGLVTIIGKTAAIPAGVDVEGTYQLIDSYIRECERMQSVEAITSLQFNMIMDFTGRVAQRRLPPGISAEIQSCMQYISLHINEVIGINDVAAHIGRSRAYVCDKFKKETNISVGQYITLCKLREARALLQYTDKPLNEISAYLAFSSQPYFQTVFKKNLGCTPLEYRNQKRV